MWRLGLVEKRGIILSHCYVLGDRKDQAMKENLGSGAMVLREGGDGVRTKASKGGGV